MCEVVGRITSPKYCSEYALGVPNIFIALRNIQEGLDFRFDGKAISLTMAAPGSVIFFASIAHQLEHCGLLGLCAKNAISVWCNDLNIYCHPVDRNPLDGTLLQPTFYPRKDNLEPTDITALEPCRRCRI